MTIDLIASNNFQVLFIFIVLLDLYSLTIVSVDKLLTKTKSNSDYKSKAWETSITCFRFVKLAVFSHT